METSSSEFVLEADAAFQVVETQPGRRVALAAVEEHASGRPFLDRIEILLGRSQADQLRDFELGRAHVVELLPTDARRQQQRGKRVWASRPAQLVALVWDTARRAAANAGLREALALSIDRQPMRDVLFQRYGEATGALLPQWMTGYAFLFPASRDLARARLMAGPAAPALTLYSDPADALLRTVADRVALNARDAGIAVRVVLAAPSDLRLARVKLPSGEPQTALEAVGRELSVPAAAESAAPEAMLAAEKRMLSGSAIIPLLHVPVLLGIAPQVRDAGPASGLRWPMEDAWLEPQ